MKSIAECLAWGNDQLQGSSQDLKQDKSVALNNQNTKFEAALLLAQVLKCERTQLLTWPEKILDPTQIEQFKEYLLRRAKGEPIAYIIGHRGFWTSDFKVTRDTLIPRPETELLIEQVLSHFSNTPVLSETSISNPSSVSAEPSVVPESPITVCDVGTGSGIIACTLAKERPLWKIIATDVSDKALEVAKANSAHLALSNITFVCTHWCEGLTPQSLDALVSNPPYIAENDPHLQQGDLRFEPRSALVSGKTGLEAYQTLIPLANIYLKPGGLLAFEHGFDQAEAITILMQYHGFIHIKTVKDLAEHPRVTLGILANI